MSTMTLQLPNSYVDIERDEMEYIDGGGGAGDLAACVCALAACAAVFLAYGNMSYNKQQNIASQWGVAIAISGVVITIALIGYTCRYIEGYIWGSIKKAVGF